MFAASHGSRADTLALKSALADAVSPELGADYWTAFGQLLTGRITRDEWQEEFGATLTPEATQLHNSLVLAILYNTTRPAQAPPASSRHTGWSKRKRDGDNSFALAQSLDPRDAKRRRVKEAVLALSKRERKRIKDLSLAPADAERVPMTSDRQRLRGPATPVALKIKGMPASVYSFGRDSMSCTDASTVGSQQDFTRCQQIALCAESKLLPDIDTLKDRMSAVAYNIGLSDGAESTAAALGVVALEVCFHVL